MSTSSFLPPPVVSPEAYRRIEASPSLAAGLLPHGRASSPYEVLDYRGTLILRDAEGARAVIRRSQRVRFLEDGVSAILDHVWGDGVPVTDYRHTAGTLAESFRDRGRHHLAIALRRPMARGQILTFAVERTALASFTAADEWLETIVDHPIARFSQCIVCQ